jgi:hypothetical protein
MLIFIGTIKTKFKIWKPQTLSITKDARITYYLCVKHRVLVVYTEHFYTCTHTSYVSTYREWDNGEYVHTHHT